MKRPDFITADDGPVRADAVIRVDTTRMEREGFIEVHHERGTSRATGFFALEALMILKPSALEGKRLRWHKRAWFIHNVVAHPAMQFLALAGGVTRPFSESLSNRLYRQAMRVHDETVPVPVGFRNQPPLKIPAVN